MCIGGGGGGGEGGTRGSTTNLCPQEFAVSPAGTALAAGCSAGAASRSGLSAKSGMHSPSQHHHTCPAPHIAFLHKCSAAGIAKPVNIDVLLHTAYMTVEHNEACSSATIGVNQREVIMVNISQMGTAGSQSSCHTRFAV